MAWTLVIEPARGRGDALLQLAHLGRQRRLVTDRARDAAEQGGDLAAGLREAEDVVDEEEHVLAFIVAEILGNRQGRQCYASAGSGGLVHLAVDECRLGDDRRSGIELGLHHVEVKVVSLAGALADAGEARDAAMGLRHVVDELHDDDGLADAGASEQADLAPFPVRGEQVDDLDPGLEDLDLGRLLLERRRVVVNRGGLLGLDRGEAIDGLADHVEDAAEALGADRHPDGAARVTYFHAAHEAVGAVHGDRADRVLAQVLGDLERQVVLRPRDAGVAHLERVEDHRELALVELDVDDGPDDLHDSALAGGVGRGGVRGGHERLRAPIGDGG